MKTGYENKVLKVNMPVRGFKVGALVPIKVDANGVPVEQYWRGRLNDAKLDGCVELVETKKKKKEIRNAD